jgi:predicted phosphodiesterase
MKFVCISDTHLNHPNLNDYPADVILYCGDSTLSGTLKEVLQFLEWFKSLNYAFKIMIPGNHDFLFQDNFDLCKILCIERGIICLNNSITWVPRKIENINQEKFDPYTTPIGAPRPFKIWGSPITPYYGGWAFNKYRGDQIKKYWDLIPDDLDILITHGPPAKVGNLGVVVKGEDVGCEDLKNTVLIKKPKYHIFGHIHEGYGIYVDDNTTYINCALLDKNKPVVFELE